MYPADRAEIESFGFVFRIEHCGVPLYAAQREISEAVSKPPYYGDDPNDHYNKKSYDMFENNYPNYYNVGYNDIPYNGNLLESILRLFI